MSAVSQSISEKIEKALNLEDVHEKKKILGEVLTLAIEMFERNKNYRCWSEWKHFFADAGTGKSVADQGQGPFQRKMITLSRIVSVHIHL